LQVLFFSRQIWFSFIAFRVPGAGLFPMSFIGTRNAKHATRNHLTMARQPAVEVGIFLSVALDALTHAPDFLRQPLKVLHLAVTFLAYDFAVNMALVIEQHVFGHIVDFYPGRWRFGVKVFVLLFYPGMVGNNIFMAVQAFFHRGYSGKIGIGHIRVAVLALNLFDPAVNIMAERDGLLRPAKGLRRGVK
jgi:hypothetical protein